MKKELIYLLTFLCICFSSSALQAQKRQRTPEQQQAWRERMQKIQNAKIAVLTEKLDLIPQQAENFWPIYNQYDREREGLRRKSRVFHDKNIEAMTEQQLREGLNMRYKIREEELNLEKQYMEKFLSVISIRQLAILNRSEREFMEVLLKKLDAQRQQPPNHQ